MDSFSDCAEESDALRKWGRIVRTGREKKKIVEILIKIVELIWLHKNIPLQKQQCKIAIYIIYENLHSISTPYLQREMEVGRSKDAGN